MSCDPIDHDIVVVGGGIHGVGVAQAAAAAGYRVLAVEQSDLAAGTSSRSSKLIHGGLRYLETGHLGLVRESLREREVLLRVAPDLVRWVPFHIPVFGSTRRRPWQLRLGLSLYALLGGLGARSRFRRLRRKEWPLEDGLRTEDLQAVFRYWDAQTDDRRLTVAVMDSARSLGAELACPARLLAAEREDDLYRVHIESGGETREATCRAVVNAAGPWIGSVLERVTPQPAPLRVDLVQGAHIVLDGELRAGVYYTEARDRRAVFLMPWYGKTLVGTTETEFAGDPATVHATDAEIEYLRTTAADSFPTRATEVLESFAGLRVLPSDGGGFNRRSRETLLVTDDPAEPRLVSIAGGKLTGYRVTALKVLAKLGAVLPPPTRNESTARLPLVPPAEVNEPRRSPEALPR